MTTPAPARASTVRAYVAFGANLGDPAAALVSTLEHLAALPATRVIACSSRYRSAPVGVSGQPDYINAVVALDTGLSPRALLDALLDFERQGGRVREHHGGRNAPRPLDLDLLLYGDTVLNEPGLEIPHPRMHLRAFVLQPLVEIAPDATIPGHGPAAALLAGVADQTITRL